MKKLLLSTLLLSFLFSNSQVAMTKTDSIAFDKFSHCDSIVFINDTDTIECLLLVSDTNKPKEVFYMEAYVIFNYDFNTIEAYLDKKKKPFPKNIVVWNHNCVVE